MLYVVSYDITDDARRLKVADALKDYGRRVQYSVFEADLTHALLEELRTRLAGLIEDEEDSVRIYTLCSECAGKVDILGQGERTAKAEVFIVG